MDPKTIDNLNRRINRVLELESMHKADSVLNYNDIASAFGAIILQLVSQIENQRDRLDALTRFIDVLRAEAKTASAAEQPPIVSGTVN